ncbi:hypothetical protein [Paraburkholderia xenovorans]
MLFSKYFKLEKRQAELDFVDIELEGDTPLYVDPYALTTRDDEWSVECHQLVVSFFQKLLQAVQANDERRGIQLLAHLGEPEETHLGVSQVGNKGRGIGPGQAKDLFEALRNSKAAKTALLEDLPDFALFIPGIGRDKISDMTTNIIRRLLISYTQSQCTLLNIPMNRVASDFFWDGNSEEWRQEYVELPVCDGKKVILIPKYTVRYQVGVDHTEYRSKFVLEFLKEEHRRADDALVTAIRDKKGNIIKKTVYKKTVDDYYPKTKDFLAEFSKTHPDVIDGYRERLKLAATKIPDLGAGGGAITERDIANDLSAALVAIAPGRDTANAYHEIMIGIVSFLYFPNLIYPKKEAEINEGRKRIDITYTNGKDSGLFYRIALDQNIKANTVHVECKNYTKDIANPEFDQLLGRFDHTRGKFGMLLYRSSEDQEGVLRRCKDAVRSNLGVILPIDDRFIVNALSLVAEGNRNRLDEQIDALFQAVIA